MPPGPDFYSTTAQVIPTFVLTYAVERRFTETDPDRPSLRGLVWVPACFAVLISAEIAAVAGAAGATSTWSARLIVVALGLGSFLIVGPFVIGYVGDSLSDPQMREHIERSPIRAGCAGGMGTLVGYAVAFVPVIVAVVIAFIVI